MLVQDEDEGPGDILDEELQKQLNQMADYDSANEEEPVAADSDPAGKSHVLERPYACLSSCHPDQWWCGKASSSKQFYAI